MNFEAFIASFRDLRFCSSSLDHQHAEIWSSSLLPQPQNSRAEYPTSWKRKLQFPLQQAPRGCQFPLIFFKFNNLLGQIRLWCVRACDPEGQGSRGRKSEIWYFSLNIRWLIENYSLFREFPLGRASGGRRAWRNRWGTDRELWRHHTTAAF